MKPIAITKENFQQEVLQSDRTVLLDFWAPWCGPCKMIAPYLEQIAQEREDIKVGKINIDEELALASQFGILSIPTLAVVEQGQIRATAVGFRPKDSILALVEGGRV